MKKLLLYVVVCISFIGLAACSGSENKIRTFGETFAKYANNNATDSIKAIYPTADFDSFAKLSSDSISVTETGDGVYKISYAPNTWIEVRDGKDGQLEIIKSHGVAAFPKEKYDIAVKTGMLNDSIPDVRAKELLSDSSYFEWLDEQAKKSYNNALSIKGGKAKLGAVRGEGNYNWTMNCTITNNLPIKLEGKDYKVVYTVIYSGEESNNWRNTYVSKSSAGKDIEAGQTINFTISNHGGGLRNPKIVLNMPMDEYLAKFYKPTGKEYSEYLKTIE